MQTYSDRYLCYPQKYKFSPFRESIYQLTQNNPRHLIGNILGRMAFGLHRISATIDYSALRQHLLFKAGIGHMSTELRILLLEASYLNCTAIIPPFVLEPAHNLNKMTTNSPAEYYDLSTSFLRTAKGEKKRLNYVLETDFLQQPHNSYQTLFFSSTATISPLKIPSKTIIARYFKTGESAIVTTFLKHLPTLYGFHQNTPIHLELAAPLKKIARQVSAKLGAYYVLRCRLPYDRHQPYRVEQIKKKLSALDPMKFSVLKDFLSGEDLCKQMIKLFPAGSNLYIASNLWKPYDEEYFAPLRHLYKVYRYYDFPELISFVEGKQPNSGKLLLIEQFLMRCSSNHFTLDYNRPEQILSDLLKIYMEL